MARSHVQFLEADLKTPLPRTFTFAAQRRSGAIYLLNDWTRSGSNQQIEMAMIKAPSKMSAHTKTLAHPK
jgi:hypothetical protein